MPQKNESSTSIRAVDNQVLSDKEGSIRALTENIVYSVTLLVGTIIGLHRVRRTPREVSD